MKWITDSKFKLVVSNSKSISDILRILGRARVGSNYDLVRSEINRLKLDTSHFNHINRKPVPLRDLLIKDSYYSGGEIKGRLLTAGLLEEKCQICRIEPIWNGKRLILRLDHINGVRNDNRLENLRLLCPNCDSQTDTFCGRNKHIRNPYWDEKLEAWVLSDGKKKKTNHCACGKEIWDRSIQCPLCSAKDRGRSQEKIEWPSFHTLKRMVVETSYSETGRCLGVSDNAIRKRLRKHAPVA